MNADEHRYKHAALTSRIISAFFAVYGELGFGFLEAVYEKALEILLIENGIEVKRQVPIQVSFHGLDVGNYRADMVVADTVLVELKAVRAIEPAHEAQTLNHLRATNLEVGLLLNFGPRPQIKRFLFDNARKGIAPTARSPSRPM